MSEKLYGQFQMVEGDQVDLHPEAEVQQGNPSTRPPAASKRGQGDRVLDYTKFTYRKGPRPEFDRCDPPHRGEAPDHDVYLELPADVPFPPIGGDYDGGHSEEQAMHYWLVCAAGQQFWPELVRMGA